ncbi:MAG: hypothetical protein EXR58_07010 [Chloroflexi bacterium]|nr:hypothetical protein [Chloroflexota bacterium]
MTAADPEAALRHAIAEQMGVTDGEVTLTSEATEATAHDIVLGRTGPGTPCGDLLRRYWYPIALVRDLTEERPIKAVRILSETLVLFKDGTGKVGLMQDRCTHVGGPMIYGWIDPKGLGCGFHDWVFDTEGNCFFKFYNRYIPRPWAKAKAYPVQQYAGIYWTYVGPEPIPALPRYDILARTDGTRRITAYPEIQANWLADGIGDASVPPISADQTESTQFALTTYGITKRTVSRTGEIDEQALILPTHLRTDALWLRTPMDDGHIWQVRVDFVPGPESGIDPAEETPEVADDESHHADAATIPPFVSLDSWGSGGGPNADRGQVLLRALLLQDLHRVHQGLDPLGTVRNPEHAIINTKLNS